MIDVSEIDLDSLTEIQLWELRYRINARLVRYADERWYIGLNAPGGHGAQGRMKALL